MLGPGTLMTVPPPTRPDRPAAGLTVVAVEDETLIALDLQDMLTEAGARQVVVVRDAASLAAALKQERPDIAIVNVEPARDGADAARMLRDAGIPFFFATGVSEPEILEHFPVPVVPKPYTVDIILEAIATTLAARR